MERQSNILIILADQLRRQALGCYGNHDVATPNIDRLARSGAQFEAACSTYPICVPFRFTLMTGQYAHTRQVPGIDWRMSPAERTLADEFNEAGYETIYIGKWHLHGGMGECAFKTPVPREHQGRWQKWFGFELRNNHYDTVVFEDDDPTPIKLEKHQTDGLTDLTLDYLQKRDPSKPFACVLSIEAPHEPRQTAEPYGSRWQDKPIHWPPNFMAEGADLDRDVSRSWSLPYVEEDREEVEGDFRRYHAMVEQLDHNVGRILDWLESSGEAAHTTVILTADHGDNLGSHCLRAKQYPFEESIGIPLLVSGLGIPVAGKISEPVCTEDLFPTLLGLAGLAPRDAMLGMNLAPLIRAPGTPLERPGVMLEFVRENRSGVSFHTREYRAFRSRRYMYSAWGRAGGMQPWLFFDLEADPYQLNNLVNDPAHEEQIRQHHQWLRDRMEETGDHAWLAEAWGIPALNPWPEGD
jgi:arylsulfatase A-like enzyme